MSSSDDFGGAFGGAPHGRCGPSDYRPPHAHAQSASDEKEGDEWFDAPEAEAEEEAPRDPEEDARLLASAQEAKERGNGHFVKAEYDDAHDCYTEAIELAPPRAPERAVFYANRAACCSKAGEYADVVQDCNAALELQPDYVKALLRRAQARESLEDFHEALEDMKRVAELDPSVKVRQHRPAVASSARPHWPPANAAPARAPLGAGGDERNPQARGAVEGEDGETKGRDAGKAQGPR